jgi:hypothetical protein
MAAGATRARLIQLGPLVTVGSLALAGAFLAYHGADLARAGAGLSALGDFVAHRGIARVPAVLRSVAGATVAALIVLAWYGMGDLLVRQTTGDERTGARDALSVGQATAYGAGVWSLVWFMLGVTGLYTAVTAVVTLVVGLALGVVALRRHRVSARPPWRLEFTGWSLPLAAMLAVALVAALTAALAPPTAKDALQYHIALPKTFAAVRALVTVPGNIASYFPLGAEMHGLWGMLIGGAVDVRVGEAAFGATLFAFFPLLLAIVYGWARRMAVPRPWALMAAASVASVPTVYDVAASGYVDLALAVYVALAIEAAARWWIALDPRHLLHVALAVGFALAVKLLALVVLSIAGMILLARVLLRARAGGPLHTLVRPAVALGAAITLGAPWYIRTWAATGSPLFPFFLDLWPGHAEGWDVQRSVMLGAFTAHYGPADPLLAALTPFYVSLTGWREIPALYEGVLGPSFLVGAILIIWAMARRLIDAEVVIVATAGIAIFAWWALSAQVLRYLLPALAPLAVGAAAAAAALTRVGVRTLSHAMIAPGVATLVVSLSWLVADAPMLPVLGTEARAAYLSRRLDYYPYYQLANDTLPPDARVWLIDMRRDTYHLERAYFSDYLFEDHTLRSWVATPIAPAELRARARRLGITHLLVRHDVLLHYDRSALVDDARPREENLARLRVVRSFLTDGTTVLRADQKFVLAALGD